MTTSHHKPTGNTWILQNQETIELYWQEMDNLCMKNKRTQDELFV